MNRSAKLTSQAQQQAQVQLRLVWFYKRAVLG
jgi:hypothetical protein